jgi:hypothetical protein
MPCEYACCPWAVGPGAEARDEGETVKEIDGVVKEEEENVAAVWMSGAKREDQDLCFFCTGVVGMAEEGAEEEKEEG